MLSMNLTVTIIKALNFQSPVKLWSEFRSWLYLSTQLFMVLLLFYLNALFLKKLRRKKGLEALIEEDVAYHPSGVIRS